jgi:AAA+ superfamily predicted ATPase
LDAFIRLWEREAALSSNALLLDCDEIDTSDIVHEKLVNRLIERIRSALVVTGKEQRIISQRAAITFDIPRLTTEEQRTTWKTVLGTAASGMNGQLGSLVLQFNLNTRGIHKACAEALGNLEGNDNIYTNPEELDTVLWEACLKQSRPRLDNLAQHIEPVATWDDLVLPEPQTRTLHEIAMHVKQRFKVYEEWGFASKGSRGLGISALFTGDSGTGKTMAAEVMANELHLDLYRIDLSQVVSKFIGETEKNLRRIFDAAEEGGAILLFDEADALFGKRSEVRDSHDRYANIEVSYLLQRMEAYRGLAILTTNMKNALDPAFLRRIRFIVQFPFPDAVQRVQIWQRIFPTNTPTEGLEVNKLGRLNVAGGNIRNIALNAAFMAADEGKAVGMKHLLYAARGECTKLERSLSEAEIGGWV